MIVSEWDYRFFTEKEMACPCCGEAKMDLEFMRKLVNLRLAFARPMVVNSGYRCETHNQAVGGAENSPHLEGKAADIKVMGKDALQFVGRAEYAGFTGIGVSQKGAWTSRFIHVDTSEETKSRPRPWIWSY